MWESMLAMAPTLIYDGLALGGDDQPLPFSMHGGLTVPVLAETSTGTRLPWLSAAAGKIADAVPAGRALGLGGDFHSVPPPVLAPALASFRREEE